MIFLLKCGGFFWALGGMVFREFRVFLVGCGIVILGRKGKSVWVSFLVCFDSEF